MKLLRTLCLTVTVVNAHYTLPSLTVGGTNAGKWQAVRQAKNWQDNGFVGDVTSKDIRCFELSPGTGAPSVANVTAGQQLTYNIEPNLYHPGPMSFYLAKVPTGQSAKTFTGDGNVWFKIWQEQPNFGSQLTWPSMNKASMPVTIPKCIASGDYLLRAEHIALHSASSKGGAQFYLSCAQLTVSGGGSTEPTNKVAFPGAYSASDPGILININYPVPTSYKNPGPDVFAC